MPKAPAQRQDVRQIKSRASNATVGFDKLASVTKKSPKSLMRMLGLKGNALARNFFEIAAYLQKKRRPALESARGIGLSALLDRALL
jgi:hypothetical protein